jgi:hypothetical protein
MSAYMCRSLHQEEKISKRRVERRGERGARRRRLGAGSGGGA